jgi:NADH-quinone oxidoreductase subunit G
MKCRINGQEVEVAPGTTIIQAFYKMQKENDIAHYCYHEGLSVAGVCRLCMVEIEGMPKLQIACNTEVKEGMVINNVSDKVKETVKWGMDFHLINHPLDCPICDQAGECGLQEQYMKFGQYDSEMSEKKVKKRKVVDLGEKVVLDSERCILCSRCVRFTAEVSKTFELGIFNRGDHSEIGTFDNKPLDNKYSVNTIDICPVGALTSKDFRFRQRVWYLKNEKSICTGCSTGCNTRVYFNEDGLFRVKPEYNEKVNGHWMCDEGRDVYKFVNKQGRMTTAKAKEVGGAWRMVDSILATSEAGQVLRASISKNGAASSAALVTGQYTNEEYQGLAASLKEMGITQIYHWKNNAATFESFDNLLLRGDKNPNTKGLLKVFGANLKGLDQLKQDLASGKIKSLVVAGPENQAAFPEQNELAKDLNKLELLIWTACGVPEFKENLNCATYMIPVKAFAEKSGTYTNHQGMEQVVKAFTTVVPQALRLDHVAKALAGGKAEKEMEAKPEKHLKTNFFPQHRGSL